MPGKIIGFIAEVVLQVANMFSFPTIISKASERIYGRKQIYLIYLKLALLFLSKGLSRGRCGQVHNCTCTAGASFASVASTF